MRHEVDARGRSRASLLALIAMIAALLALAGCDSDEADTVGPTGSGDGTPASGGGSTLRMTATPDVSLDPVNAPGETDLLVLHNVYQRLVGYDFGTSKVVPELATRWDVAVGGRTYTFHLDPGARFASGNPVTAQDVKYSLDRVVAYSDGAQAFQVAPYLTDDSVKVIDPQTVRITLAAPSAGFLAALSGTASSILDSKVVEEHAGKDGLAKAWLASNTAGSGPFSAEDWIKDSRITLRKNPEFRGPGPRPTLDSVVINYVESGEQAVSLLRGGDLDVATSLLPSDVKSLQEEGYGVKRARGTATYYLSMNMRPGSPFAKSEVREAVRGAVDYRGLVDQLLAGQATQVGGVIPDGLLGYDSSLNTKYSTDLEGARELLADAGYPDGFKTDLYYQSDSPVLGVSADTIAAKLQADLERVGIQLRLRGEPSATVFPKYQEGKLPLVFWYFGPTTPDPDVIMSPHGDSETQATTRVNYDDATVTEQIQRARTATDREERRRLYEEAQQRVAEDGPYAFLFRPIESAVTREGVEFPVIPIWGADLARARAG
jgi:peptide/nickel transport system substrate-binding protein